MRGEPPRTVIWAVWLMRASILLGYAGLFVGPDITRELRGASPDELTFNLAFFFVVLALTALVYLWLIQKVKVGRNWARIVMLVLTAFGILALVPSAGAQSPVQLALNFIDTLIDVAAMVLVFRPPGSQWFRPAGAAGPPAR